MKCFLLIFLTIMSSTACKSTPQNQSTNLSGLSSFTTHHSPTYVAGQCTVYKIYSYDCSTPSQSDDECCEMGRMVLKSYFEYDKPNFCQSINKSSQGKKCETTTKIKGSCRISDEPNIDICFVNRKNPQNPYASIEMRCIGECL